VPLATALLLAVAACSPTSAARTPDAAASSAPSATFSGASSGTVVIDLCTDSGDDSIYVTVTGSARKLPGEVSSSQMDFDGADSIYTIDKTGPLPVFSTDGTRITLDGVKLASVLDPSKVLTFAGTIACP
jgi:hypothetical protein